MFGIIRRHRKLLAKALAVLLLPALIAAFWHLTSPQPRAAWKANNSFRWPRFSPDAKTVLTTEESADWENVPGTVHIWDIETGQRRFSLTEPWPMAPILFSPDGQFLAALLFKDAVGYADIKARVDELRGSPELRRDKLPELELTGFASWADESLGKARTVAYLDGKLRGARRPARGEGPAEVKAPVLPEGYTEAAAAVARRRMVVAGYRLADQVRAALR